ncbi:MAG: endonuclease [Arthrobacter sp.]|nr:endonuclease [Arthrobacter sp.]
MEGNRLPVAVLAGRGNAVAGAAVADVARTLGAVRPAPESAGLIEQLRELEDLKSAAAALQARIAVAFDAAQRRDQRAAGIPAAGLGAGVAAQMGVSDCLCRRAVAGRVIGESLWL